MSCLTATSIGRAVVDLSGEEPSKAALLKVIGNVLIMTTMETVAELSVFSEKSGLGTTNMRSLIETLLPSSPHMIYWDKMAGGDYYLEQVCQTPKSPIPNQWRPTTLAAHGQSPTRSRRSCARSRSCQRAQCLAKVIRSGHCPPGSSASSRRWHS